MNSRGWPSALAPSGDFFESSAVVDASVALTCPKCGQLGDGDPNCCSPGGSWHGMCEGGAGGGQYTFHDGYQACSEDKLAASVLPGMPFSCPETKRDVESRSRRRRTVERRCSVWAVASQST